jgi:glutathione reductase (NADPH)
MKTYDLVVIGTGTAARSGTRIVRAAGRSVAVIDRLPFGGTCALRGCDPKKVLVAGAEALDFSHRMRDHGIAGDICMAWRDLVAFKRSFTDPVPADTERNFVEQGIDVHHGTARFTGPGRIDVDGVLLSAQHFLIASGARPVPLAIPGEDYVTTSDAFMELPELPQRIVMIGGGYIAGEFSHLAARAGACVTVLQRGPRMLPHFDPDLIGWLSEKARDTGIDIRTGTTVTAVERSGTELRVKAHTGDGEVTVATDLVVHAAGRVPDIRDLDLPAANVATHDGKIVLDDHLQSTSNPIVYAAGDSAAKGPPLTPVSAHDGKIVARNILDGNRHKPDYRAVPSVAFTLPPIAAVGLSEAEARQRFPKLRVNSADAAGWYTARRVRESVYGYKTLIDQHSGRIVGAHLVGPHADEVINIFAMAIRHGVAADTIKATIFAYPTAASDLGEML